MPIPFQPEWKILGDEVGEECTQGLVVRGDQSVESTLEEAVGKGKEVLPTTEEKEGHDSTPVLDDREEGLERLEHHLEWERDRTLGDEPKDELEDGRSSSEEKQEEARAKWQDWPPSCLPLPPQIQHPNHCKWQG